MAEEEKKKSFGRKVWEVFQTIGAGAGVIALQHVIEEALMGFGKKTGEQAGKKVEEWFGLAPDSSGEGQVDNAIVDKVISFLGNDPKREIRNFCQDLYQKDPGKYKRFTGRVALLAEIDAEKKTVRKQPPKGKQGPSETTESKKRDYETAKAFLEELLTYSDYDSRLNFLQGAGVFEKKEEAPGIKFTKKTAAKIKDFAEKATSVAIQAEKENRQDFNSTMASWREKSKAWRNSR